MRFGKILISILEKRESNIIFDDEILGKNWKISEKRLRNLKFLKILEIFFMNFVKIPNIPNFFYIRSLPKISRKFSLFYGISANFY